MAITLSNPNPKENPTPTLTLTIQEGFDAGVDDGMSFEALLALEKERGPV